MTSNELAHELTEAALDDLSLAPGDRLMLGFGLLDLLDDYAVALYLLGEFVGVDAPHPNELTIVWRYCREVLERCAEPITVSHWLWADWFESPDTVLTAFSSVSVGWDDANAGEETIRRIDRVLRISGPVPWDVKLPMYRNALNRPVLWAALLDGLRGSFHDVYGSIDGDDALVMTERLAADPALAREANSLARAIREHLPA